MKMKRNQRKPTQNRRRAKKTKGWQNKNEREKTKCTNRKSREEKQMQGKITIHRDQQHKRK